ncbi:MAG: Ig domain protein group 2 domain protein, partial [Dehalococcoidales bacterium]|nr:Ig domain protein group 2 domain protein [Dehalococcoidales bacterium]
ANSPVSFNATATTAEYRGSPVLRNRTNAAVTVEAIALRSLAVSPESASIALGQANQFTVTGTYSNGSTNATSGVTWASSDTGIATISATGKATSVSIGSVVIWAVKDGIESNTALLNITAPTLSSIVLTPTTPSIAAGRTVQFTANGTYTDGSWADMTSVVAWTSDNTSAAIISASGLATGIAIDNIVVITANDILSGKTGTATLTVTVKEVTSFVIVPARPVIAAGTTLQFKATAFYSDGSFADETAASTWSSNNTAAATVNPTTGLAAGVAKGIALISARLPDNSTATTLLTVTDPTLISVAIREAAPTVVLGRTLQLHVDGIYSDNLTKLVDLTTDNRTTWASLDLSVATISTTGNVTSKKVGIVTIRATHRGLRSSANFTVAPAVLEAITVAPATPKVGVGATLTFTSTGNYSDGTMLALTDVTWTSSDNGTATIISTTGQATAKAQGTTNITATRGSVSGFTTLTVTGATLNTITVTPVNPSLPAGRTTQFKATGTYSDNSTLDITDQAAWTSSNITAATIVANTGRATGKVAGGSTTITATMPGVTPGTTTLTVIAAELDSIAVTPANPSAAEGRTVQFTATGTYSNNTTAVITNSVTWTTTAALTANITSTGSALARAVGTVTITAILSGKSGETTLTVTPKELVSISVSPTTASLAAGQKRQLSATGTYTDTTTADITSTVAWSSNNTAVASVSATGLATTYTAGLATITAALGAATSGTAAITVGIAVLDTISVTPVNPTIQPGSQLSFRAFGTYTDGTSTEITRDVNVTWNSVNQTVATIITSTGTSAGRASGLVAGNTVIRATMSGVSGSTTLTVASLRSLQVSPILPFVAAGRTQQFSAIGTFADNTTADLTGLVIWTSSNTSAARINRNTGLATTRAQGTTLITAETGSGSSKITSPAVTLTVTAAVLDAIMVTPVNRRVTLEPPKPLKVQMKAHGIYTNSDVADITDNITVTWTSSNPATANITATGGRVTGLASGTVTITAALGSVSGTATLTVLPDRTAPVVTLTAPTEGFGQREKSLTVTGKVDDTSANVTVIVNGVTANATLDAEGNFAQGVALKSGSNSVEVRAVDASGNGGRSPTVAVTVDPKKPSITITSPVGGLLTNKTTPLTVTGNVTGANSVTLWFNGVANPNPIPVVGGGFTTSVTLKKGVNLIVVTAYATEGPGDADYLGTSGIVVVSLDPDAPVVTLDSPTAGSVLNTPLARVSGTVNDPFTSNVTLTLNGIPQIVSVAGGIFSQDVSLQPGLNTITVVAADKAGNTSTASPTLVTLNTAAPRVTLVAPRHRSLTNIAAQTINGTLSDPTIQTATLLLNSDAPRTISVAPDGTFNQIVTLVRGANRIEVRALASDNSSTGTSGNVTVTLDDVAPGIKVDLYDPTSTIVITVTSNETLAAAPIVKVTPATVAPLAQPMMLAIGVNGWAGTYGSTATPIAVDTYTVNVTGKDEAGNATTVTATFVKGAVNTNGVDPATVSSGGSSLSIETNGAVTNADISLTQHLGNPSGSFMSPAGASQEAGAFVEIIAAADVVDNLRRVLIKVNYDRASLPAGTEESTLRLYEWNVTYGTWRPIPDPFSGVNMTAQPPYIWGYVEHLSKYGGFGKAVVAPPAPTPTPPPSGGGGGAPETPAGTTTLTGFIDSQGVITTNIVATSGDAKVDLTLPQGTKALSKEGVPLTQITMVGITGTTTPPTGSAFVSLVYAFGPTGATFAPPITVRFRYDVTSIPRGVAEGKLQVAMFDSVTGTWTLLDGVVVDTVSHVITAKVSRFGGLFAVVAYNRPASFTVSGLSISPTELAAKDTVTISVTAKNSGDLTGSYSVTLKINGAVVETKEISLAGGVSATVSFTTTRDADGTYSVDVNGLTGTFVVKAGAAPTPKPAAFTVSALAISPSEVDIKQPVTISIAVRNTGEASGSYDVTLKIDGVKVETKSVAVAGGATQTVTFTVTKDAAGTYTVDVNGLTGKFVVKAGAVEPVVPPVKGVSPWLIIGIIVVVIVIGLGAWWFVRQRRS